MIAWLLIASAQAMPGWVVDPVGEPAGDGRWTDGQALHSRAGEPERSQPASIPSVEPDPVLGQHVTIGLLMGPGVRNVGVRAFPRLGLEAAVGMGPVGGFVRGELSLFETMTATSPDTLYTYGLTRQSLLGGLVVRRTLAAGAIAEASLAGGARFASWSLRSTLTSTNGPGGRLPVFAEGGRAEQPTIELGLRMIDDAGPIRIGAGGALAVDLGSDAINQQTGALAAHVSLLVAYGGPG